MKIGIDLGGSHIGVGLIEEEKIIDVRETNFTKEDKENFEESLVKYIFKFIDDILSVNNIPIENIELIGVASPGTISNGIIVRAGNLKLENFDLSNIIKTKYNVPTKITNDAKSAALAEKKYGAMKDYTDCVFLCIGTGIGGAAFLGGKLLEPKKNSGFEFGHIVVEKDGKLCTCGKRGCIEKYASIQALKMQVTKDLNMDSNISGQYLRENLLILDNEKVQKDLEDFLEYLKIEICNLIDIFEPEIVCLGGSFSHYEGNPIFDRLIDKINSYNSTFNHETNHKIVLAKFKNDAGIIGSTICM